MTRLATFISPDEMTKDPMFTFNSTLPEVPNLRTADAFLLCGSQQYTRCDAPVRLRLPDGREIDFRSSYGWSGACYGSPGTYHRGELDVMPALERAWAREAAGEGDSIHDNRPRIGEAVSRHNRAVDLAMPPGRPGDPGVSPPPPNGEAGMSGCGSCGIGGRSAGAGGVALALALLASRLRRRGS